jgi:hypothetical protein
MIKNKPIDEREKNILRTVATRMYLMTLVALWADMIYRTFALGQSSEDFEDIAVILTANVLVLLAAFFWNAGLNLKRAKFKHLASGYLLMFALGTVFILLKYGTRNLDLILDKLGITAAILAIMAAGYALLAHFGAKKAEKDLED